ncbi:hypothetical protein Acsp04_14850 [Actinomadura sp. NBRC 104425]|nr:hypothetical protein Acsp04_14850 [Actinomadura sp. NBRC 104425]
MTAVARPPGGGPAPGGARPPSARVPAPPGRHTPPPRSLPLLPRTVAGRVRALTALVILALVALLASTWWAVGAARDGVRVIGHDAGPQVVATGDLYFHLTDMDAHLANALLIGNSRNLGMRRDQLLARYEQSRAEAGAALLQASRLADGPTERETARDLLDALGRYERYAGQALLLDEQADHAAGPPPQRVLDAYRQATDLMKLDLLPKAYNLTLDNGTLVRHTYESERSAVLVGRTLVVVIGVLLLALLLALNHYLYVRFRRVLNPGVALATLAALVLVVMSTSMLSSQAGHLRDAKRDGFDPILALSRTRAISNSANADQTRFLLDPDRADTYTQTYLSKSQSILYLQADSLPQYTEAVESQGRSRQRARFLGFLGDEAARDLTGGQAQAFQKVLDDFRTFQLADRRIRDLAAAGRTDEAVRARLGTGPDTGIRLFAQYDASLNALAGLHRRDFDDAVRAGDEGTDGWDAVLPVSGLVILVLVAAGVRPRLAEYR